MTPKYSTFHNITCWHRSPIDFEIYPTRSKAVLCFSGRQSCGQILITPQAFDSSPLWLEIPTNHVNTHKQDESGRKEVYEKFMRSFQLIIVLNVCCIFCRQRYIAYLVCYRINNTHRNTLETKLIMFITLEQNYRDFKPRDPSCFNIIQVLLPKLFFFFCLTVNISTFGSARSWLLLTLLIVCC